MNQVIKKENLQLPAKQEDSTSLMAVIERIALMPELNIDRLEKLFSMHNQMLDRNSETAYNEALAKAQGEMQAVSANKKNDHTKSKYANLEAVHQVCKPIWTGHGFSVSTSLKKSSLSNHVLVICEVRHCDGFKRIYENDWPLDIAGAKGTVNKTPIQAMGATASYGRRYTELLVFDISIKHDDNDGNQSETGTHHQTLTQVQIKNIRDAMKEADVSEESICKKAQVQRIEDLPQARMRGCINTIKSMAIGKSA